MPALMQWEAASSRKSPDAGDVFVTAFSPEQPLPLPPPTAAAAPPPQAAEAAEHGTQTPAHCTLQGMAVDHRLLLWFPDDPQQEGALFDWTPASATSLQEAPEPLALLCVRALHHGISFCNQLTPRLDVALVRRHVEFSCSSCSPDMS